MLDDLLAQYENMEIGKAEREEEIEQAEIVTTNSRKAESESKLTVGNDDAKGSVSLDDLLQEYEQEEPKKDASKISDLGIIKEQKEIKETKPPKKGTCLYITSDCMQFALMLLPFSLFFLAVQKSKQREQDLLKELEIEFQHPNMDEHTVVQTRDEDVESEEQAEDESSHIGLCKFSTITDK